MVFDCLAFILDLFQKKSTTAKIGEFFKLPSFRKKSKQPEKQNGAKSARSMSCSDACNAPSCRLGRYSLSIFLIFTIHMNIELS